MPNRTVLPDSPATDGSPASEPTPKVDLDLQQALDQPVLIALEEAEAEESLTWWDRNHLWLATIGCWIFTIAGILGMRLLDVPKTTTNALFILAYLFGGTL